jgi:Tol biopolymer transport system component
MTRGPFGTRAFFFLLTLLLGAVVLPPPADAQYFGRNKVQYKTFETRVLETEHFDIYYYPEMEDIIGEAGRMAERWFARIARLLDHELKGRQPLILYASHPDFEQTNAVFGQIGESTGGVTEVLKRRIVLPLAGTLNESDHVLGHELVHAFQFDITSLTGEGGIGFRGPTALLLPLWFIEGMAEYLSVGPVDAHTAMWMRDAAACNCRLPTLRDLTTRQWDYFPYRWGQAFWAFVAGKWGDEAVGKVLKVAGQSGNPEQALEAVLQIPIPQLEAEWHQAIYDAYASVAQEALGDRANIVFAAPPSGDGNLDDQPAEADVEEVKQLGDLHELAPLPQHGNATQLVSQKMGSGGLNVGPSLSPDGSRVVFLSEKDLFAIEMFLADAETGKVIRRLTKAAVDSHFESLQFINSSGAWSTDGRHFAFGVVVSGRPAITVIEAETGKKVQEVRFEELGEIYTPSFSPDGRSVVFAAIVGGYTDLFILDLETEQLRRLTSDFYSDLQPSWSPDGGAIAFVTDRFTTDLSTLSYGNYRLGLIDPSTGEIQAMPVFGVGKHIDPQWAPDGQSLYFVTDVSGISNVYRYEFQGGNLYQVTDLVTGVSGITALSPAISSASASNRLVYTAFERGDYNLYRIDAPEDLEGEPIEAAIAGASPAMLPPQDRSPGLVSVLLDEPELGLADTLTFAGTGYSPGITLDYVSQPQLAAGADRYGAFLAGGISLYFSDMLGNRNLSTLFNINTANGSLLRSSAVVVGYENRRTRWNWTAELGQVPYITSRYGIAFDEVQGVYIEQERREWQVNRIATLGISYPINRANRIELTGGYQGIDFYNEVRTSILSLSGAEVSRENEELPSPGSLNMGTAAAALVYDNTIFGGTGPMLGQRYRLEVSPRVGDLNYVNALVDFRRYIMPVRPTTFAFRLLHFGRYGSDSEATWGDIDSDPLPQYENRRVLSDLYLGYPSIIRGYNDGSFSGQECAGSIVSSCDVYNNLFGTRILTANFEYRIPLIGFFGVVPSAGAPPLDIAPFFDVGVAWRDGVTPSLNCDGNGQTILVNCSEVVASIGIAGRLNLLGFMILELDFVNPLSRPDKGWYFQFSLLPAF